MNYTNLKINEKCIKCGSCLGCGYDFLSSANDGSIIVKDGTMLHEDSEEFKTLKDICPMDAFILDKTIMTTTEKKQLIKKLLQELNKYEEITAPTPKELSFCKDEYKISSPSTLGDLKYVYSNHSAAEKAALNEFESNMYYRLNTIILKIVTEYRVKHVKPYYTVNIDEGSVYAKNNNKISEILQTILNLADEKFDKDFVKIDVFPNKECDWKMLNNGELISDECISAIRNEFDYTSNDYSCYWDTDSKETYSDGKSMQKYCYKNINKAYEKFAEDILNSCYYARYRMEDTAVQVTEWLVKQYNKEIKKVIKSKIKQIRKIVFPKYKTNFEHLELNDTENCGYEMNILSNIPTELSDYIGGKYYYVESENYIVWLDYTGIGITRSEADEMEKFFEYTDIKENEIHYKYKIFDKKNKSFKGWYELNRNDKIDFKICDNKIIFSDFDGLFAKDIISGEKELLYRGKLSLFRDFKIRFGKVWFFDWDNKLKIIDIKTKQVVFTLNKKIESYILESPTFELSIYEERLVCEGSNRDIVLYNFDTKKITTLYQYEVPKDKEIYADTEPFMYVQKINIYKDFAVIIYWDIALSKSKILRINLSTNEKKILDVSADSFTTFLNFYSNINMPYVVFIDKGILYIYDIDNHNIKSIEMNFPSDISKLHIVGDYIYWGYGKKPDNKMNLCDLE